MAFCDVKFWANAIQKQSGMYVLLPYGDGPFPVLYLLHGLSDDHTIWHRRTRLEAYIADLPLIVVMADGHRSFYCNSQGPGAMAYEDHIIKDVVGFVDRTFPTIAHRGSRAIAGLSMGGFGATMLALKHHDMFGAAASHSGAVRFSHGKPYDKDHGQRIAAIAPCIPAGKYDCFKLAAKAKAARQMPAYRFDCGTEDFLLRDNREFRDYLTKIKFPHEYHEYPGGHNWDYWDLHIRDTLAFVMKNIGGKREKIAARRRRNV